MHHKKVAAVVAFVKVGKGRRNILPPIEGWRLIVLPRAFDVESKTASDRAQCPPFIAHRTIILSTCYQDVGKPTFYEIVGAPLPTVGVFLQFHERKVTVDRWFRGCCAAGREVVAVQFCFARLEDGVLLKVVLVKKWVYGARGFNLLFAAKPLAILRVVVQIRIQRHQGAIIVVCFNRKLKIRFKRKVGSYKHKPFSADIVRVGRVRDCAKIVPS